MFSLQVQTRASVSSDSVGYKEALRLISGTGGPSSEKVTYPTFLHATKRFEA